MTATTDKQAVSTATQAAAKAHGKRLAVTEYAVWQQGAMTAAQLFDAAKRADADVLPGIARGDFSPLVAWLRINIHAKGSLLPTDELLTQATGRPLDAAVYEQHLRRRYLEDE